MTDDPAAPILERARALVEDIDFESVRAWKRDHPDAKVVGHMPVYAPRPLFEALGCLPVAVFGGGDRLDIIRGDSFYQSYICHIPRSTLELALTGRLDAFDAMVFPSICDVIRNLSGMWQMLFPERYAAYLDLPQNFDPAVGGRFYRDDLQRIASELTRRGARPLTDDALRASIRDENARRAALADLDALRQNEPWRLRASEAWLLARAGGVMPAAQHTEFLREALARLHERAPRAYDNIRVVVRGAFCEQPPLALIRTLEAAGCDLVDDDFQLGLRYLEAPIDEASGDPLAALVEAFLLHGTATASRYIGDLVKGEALVRRVRETRAEGVIFAAASF